ncbi:MAG: hypothetical protein ACTTKH_06620 [Treponema sp.]
MKHVFLFLNVVFFSVLLTSCPNRYYYLSSRFSESNKRAVVYLHVLNENGEVILDSQAKRFKIDYSGRSRGDEVETVLNTEDHLIYKLSDFYVYFPGDVPTEADMKKALENDYYFALKDIKEPKAEYKTVIKTFKDTYKRYEKNPAPNTDYTWCAYIYHCEVKLEKKTP